MSQNKLPLRKPLPRPTRRLLQLMGRELAIARGNLELAVEHIRRLEDELAGTKGAPQQVEAPTRLPRKARR